MGGRNYSLKPLFTFGPFTWAPSAVPCNVGIIQLQEDNINTCLNIWTLMNPSRKKFYCELYFQLHWPSSFNNYIVFFCCSFFFPFSFSTVFTFKISFHSDIWWWFWNPGEYVWNDKYFLLNSFEFPASFKFFVLLTFPENVFIVFLRLVG